jgi:uncharacterized membrane protein
MTLATLYLTALRLIHVFGAAVWIGGGIWMVSVIAPTAAAAGPEGARFMQWLARAGRLGRTFALASVLTTLSGVLLYWPISGNMNGAWITAPRGLTLTLGAVFGLLTFLHGALVSGRLSSQAAALAREMTSRQGPPAPEQLLAAQQLGAKSSTAAVHSVILGSVALLLMAAAQTMPATF